MGAAQLFEHVVAVVLHAQRHPVEALGAQLAQKLVADAVGVSLKGDLGVFVYTEAVLDLGKDPAQVVRPEEGRRAAAEIDGVHHVVRGPGAGLFKVDGKRLHVVVHQPLVPAAADGVKITVLAFAPAEGDVDVNAQGFQFVVWHSLLQWMLVRYSSIFSTAIKASEGTETVPKVRIRFLPSFCFSSSFFLRVMSPP